MSIRNILKDLQSGALTKAQAMRAIERLKAQEGGTGLLVAVPRWQDAPEAPSPEPRRFAAHSILWGGFPSLSEADLENRFPESHRIPLPATGPDAAEAYQALALACFDRVQHILKSRPRQNVLLQILAPDQESGRMILGLAGLLKSAAMEEPRLSARILLAPPDAAKDQLLDLLASAPQGAPVACIRAENGRTQILGWEESETNGDEPKLPYKENGVYLITGGLGRLGTVFAEEILAKTARARVILTGRAPLSESIQSRLRALCPEAGRVAYLQLDPSNLSQVKASVTGLLREAGGLNGVIHAAGCVRDNFIVKKTREEFLEVLAPKVAGTWNLDEATRHAELDFFALFSSGAAVLGNVGQSDYAAANGFLDRFAFLRDAMVAAGQRKGKTLSLNWPLWKNGGLRVGEAEEKRLRETFGMQALETATGLSSFARCLGLAAPQAVVVAGDLRQLRHGLFSAPAQPEAPKAITQPAAAPATDRVGWTTDFFRREFSSILGVGYHELDPAAPLEKYGINSILAMNLTAKLESAFGPLSKTLFFEYQTIRDLAAYFAEAHAEGVLRLQGPRVSATLPSSALTPVARKENMAPAGGSASRPLRRRPAPAAQAPAREPDRRKEDPIAIIGLSGRYPLAKDLGEFWENLKQGKDCVTEIPPERWDWKEHYSADRTRAGSHYSKWGGFISGADEFDSRFFNISIKEAENIDPQERIFLQHAWAALEDAGYTRSGLRANPEGDAAGSADVGVYVGVMYSDYQLFSAGTDDDGKPLPIGASHASVANRVSYVLDLHGPSIALDTMCSSSLSAIHLACQDLKGGRTAMAIAGGVNLTLHPNKYLVLSNGQFISSHGHCQSFGEGGDGYIPGEGVGAVILKRLSEALRDGDHVYGIIRGSALNHGGKTNGYSVPNPAAQAQVIRMALREAGIDPRSISYAEAHGTGTKLGDPIEIAALTRVFQEHSKDTGYCLIGSAKSNIGHCESAAGIAGLTKVLLQMQHRQIVPSLHSQRLNPNIDFSKTPFVVNQTLKDWERPVVDGVEQPRIAALSSFGAGGSNAHLILQEFATPVGAPEVAGPEEMAAVPLSARTAEQLKQKAIDLAGWLGSGKTTELPSLAYTLQAGREAMDKRAAFLARSPEHLRELLLRFADGETEGEGIFQAKQKADRETIALFTADEDLRDTLRKWINERKYAKLLDLWAKGVDLDWSLFHDGRKPAKISLPTYPFARERCWFRGGRARGTAAGAMQGAIHPYLHRNTSGFGRQSYTSTFSQSAGLSPFGCLAMAAAAIRDALGKSQSSDDLRFEGILWGEVPSFDGDVPVHIELAQSDEDAIEFEIYCESQGEEHVLCQGRGALNEGPQPSAGGKADLDLDPALIQKALEDFHARQGGGGTPSYSALESARFSNPAARGSQARVRFSDSHPDGSAVDVDLIDASGKVTTELRGLSWADAGTQATPASEAPALEALPLRISLQDAASSASTATEIRSGGITLVTLDDVESTEAPAASLLREGDDGIFTLSLPDPSADGGEFEALVRDAVAALEKSGSHPSVKALLIEAPGSGFPGQGEGAREAMLRHRLGEAMLAFPFPIVALAKGDALGGAFLWAAYSDIPVFTTASRYSMTKASRADWNFFAARFGAAFAERFLTQPEPALGNALREMGLTAAIVPAQEADEFAATLVRDLAGKSREALRLLKRHLTREWRHAAAPQPDAVAVSTSQRSDEAGELDLPIPFTKHGDGAFLLRTADFPAAGTPEESITFLRDISARIAGHGESRAILLECEKDFLPGTESGFSPSLAADFRNLVEACSVPVIAILRAGMNGPGWLLSLLCDGAVWNSQEAYGCGDVAASDLHRVAWTVLTHRFGEATARGLLLARETLSGNLLVTVSGACATGEAMLPKALALADAGRIISWESRRAWKRMPDFDVAVEIEAAPRIGLSEEPFDPSVLRMEELGEGVVLVALEDKQSKNMFSPRLVSELTEAFARINRSASCRAVILTGCDTFFASGGTQETLLDIQHGEAKFTDNQAFQLALQCKVPVIAAMQGHAIGAGWVLGLMADFVLFSEESRYRSPYMDYGFTPGAGATFVLPARLGADVAIEGLYTGREYSGKELKARNGALRIHARADILDAARSLAGKIASLPPDRLVALKRLWSRPFAEKLAACCRLEVEMHAKTLVGNTQALQRIQAAFPGPAKASEAAVPAPQHARAAEGLDAVLAQLRSLLAAELLIGEDEIEEETEFVELGLDSVTGVTWIRKINASYGTAIEATKIYSHPTLGKLGRFVAQQIPRSAPHAAPEAQAPAESPAVQARIPARATAIKAPAPAPAASALPKLASRRKLWRGARKSSADSDRMTDPIAVIGMAGQFPMARDTDAFWKNLSAGRNCISEVAPDRWNLDRYFEAGAPKPGKTYSKWLGALEAYDRFDPLFFNISPVEAEIMDPQQRLFLQSGWHAIEDAGYDPQSLSGSKCGVFVGCASGDYHQASKEHELSAYGFTGSATSILAARISYFLNLRGPCLAIETACSSSLVAIANACDSLNTGTSDLALAGGVYVMTGPGLHVKTSQAGMLSADGKCHTFDQGANGFVPGEAVGAVLLKRLSDAQRDGDCILGVIRGWGVNQDGKTNGITAPNAESQRQLESDVYARFGIDPAGIQLVEAHGTGTKLGDPIEVEALKESFRAHTRREGYCAIGSVKSNIGHCLTAAGIAGFIKILLALRHKQLPPTLHFNKLNEHIELRGSPFYVNARLAPWDIGEGEERRAAISSFGFSGTNAHLVIGEGPEPQVTGRAGTDVHTGMEMLFPFSARSRERLERKVRDHLEFLETHDVTASLPSVAYTLQAGREAMEHRVIFVADSLTQLRSLMQAFLSGEDTGKGFFSGVAKRKAKPVDASLRDPIASAEGWAKGQGIDWSRLHTSGKPAKIRLPLYPFAEERYWLSSTSNAADAAPQDQADTGSEAAHPLLHKKTGDLLQQACTPWLSPEGTLAPAGPGGADAASAPVKRIPLPTYPFARDKVWPERPEAGTPAWDENGGDGGAESIERLFERIERQSIGSREAARLLRDLP